MGTRFLQTRFWTSFKARHGWSALYFSLDSTGKIEPLENSAEELKDGKILFSVLTRSFSVKIKKFTIAYVPMAPEYDADMQEYFKTIKYISDQLKTYLPENTICVRFDPPVDFYDCSERDVFKKQSASFSRQLGIKLSPVAVQPPDTTILDLTKTEDEILSGMKNKWRYNIKLSSKKGVQVFSYTAGSEGFDEAFENFYKLFEETSKRDGVSFHGKDYYKDLFEYSKSFTEPEIRLYIAKHENDYLAGIITLFCAREAVYLYGASGNVKRNLMPAYLLQWTAICDAKKYGSPVYDFYGMPPTNDENHPMHGLYLFKTGFGGALIHRPGSYDAVIKKSDYSFYTLAERLRAWYHRVFLKKIAGR